MGCKNIEYVFWLLLRLWKNKLWGSKIAYQLVVLSSKHFMLHKKIEIRIFCISNVIFTSDEFGLNLFDIEAFCLQNYSTDRYQREALIFINLIWKVVQNFHRHHPYTIFIERENILYEQSNEVWDILANIFTSRAYENTYISGKYISSSSCNNKFQILEYVAALLLPKSWTLMVEECALKPKWKFSASRASITTIFLRKFYSQCILMTKSK